MSGIVGNGFMGRGGGLPPSADLAWWYRADLDAKITTANGSVTEWRDDSPDSWVAQDLVSGSDPVHNSAGGYIQFTNGQRGLQSEQFTNATGLFSNNSATNGFMMMVVEFDAIVADRWLSGICLASPSLGANSGNQYGNFFTFSSGGIKLRYRGRMTADDGVTFLNIDGTTNISTGTKYLLQIYVPPAGGTYFEIDGNAQNNDATGGKFPCIVRTTDTGTKWKADFGGLQGTSWISGQSHKMFEFIGYQSYDATVYSQVETYLKTKYGIA